MGSIRTTPRAIDSPVPGLAVVAGGVAVAMFAAWVLPSVSALTVAVLLGAVVANVVRLPASLAPGFKVAGRRLLRVGIVLLGLKLVVRDVLALGYEVLALAVVAVVVTFVVTRWLGRVLGVGEGLSLLIATGFSICGASAVAAMNGVREQDEEDVARALGLVTLFGTVAMFSLPALHPLTGLSPAGYGVWAGGSVHEVAQVVAAAGPVAGALAIAVAVKLTRVVLLAPMLAAVSIAERRKFTGTRPPIVPLFVVGFLAAAAVRATGLLPEAVLSFATFVDNLLLAAGMFALGTAVRLRSLVRSGLPALVLGLLSTVLIAAVALTGALLIT
ncbi:YeiH family protein [Lentzea nigeriaca]|uniref:YeiH family protein n=1 Tax=Lentzea nigeriaca TaxID=1128665 RepID=UPI00195C4EE6|nr:putative sulfate exporter family transporter [Lentzea nigeriaca]MBM7856557.1 putative integral membrane protein (TIGR00698 family) [Lentzea nigeriaca]